jgi:arginine utilization regulatory protein
VIEHAMVVTDGPYIVSSSLPPIFMPVRESIVPLRQKLTEIEYDLVQHAMLETDGNIQQAAKLLGIPRQSLQYKLQKYKTAAE